MLKMAILAAPTTDPTVTLRQRSEPLPAFESLVNFGFRFQSVLGTLVTFLCLRTLLALRRTAAVIAILANLAIHATRAASRVARLTSRCLNALDKSKVVKRFKKKVEYEFYVLILGPSGNAMILLMFWPGWIIVTALMGYWFWS